MNKLYQYVLDEFYGKTCVIRDIKDIRYRGDWVEIVFYDNNLRQTYLVGHIKFNKLKHEFLLNKISKIKENI